MPTVDSNSMEIELLKKEIWSLKANSAADKPQKGRLITEIAGLMQSSMTASFLEEEKRIKMDAQDKDALKSFSDGQFSSPRQTRNIHHGLNSVSRQHTGNMTLTSG